MPCHWVKVKGVSQIVRGPDGQEGRIAFQEVGCLGSGFVLEIWWVGRSVLLLCLVMTVYKKKLFMGCGKLSSGKLSVGIARRTSAMCDGKSGHVRTPPRVDLFATTTLTTRYPPQTKRPGGGVCSRRSRPPNRRGHRPGSGGSSRCTTCAWGSSGTEERQVGVLRAAGGVGPGMSARGQISLFAQ